MPFISIHEHGRLRVGQLDDATPSVSARQAEVLSQLKRLHKFDIFKFVDKDTLLAQQFVGAVQVGGLTVEVLPKIDGVDGKTTRRNLVGMLAVAFDLDISEGDVARVSTQKHGILEILIRLFCDKLFAQVRRGLAHRYEGREENLPVLRGRLGVVEQVRLNATHPERLYCRFDEFVEDTPLNQVLKAAVRLLLPASRDVRNHRKLAELLFVFNGVADATRSSLPWSKVAFDRTNQRFRSCFRLAELFLKSTFPDVTGGRAFGYSLFFDMNELFERYIGHTALRAFRPSGLDIQLQGPRRHLAFDEERHRDVFALLPDVTASDAYGVSWILDTKWKELSLAESRDGVVQADMYQMYAYAKCFGCRDVTLLYPHHSGLGQTAGVRARYRTMRPKLPDPASTAEARIRVATVDLADLRTVAHQLRALMTGLPSTCREASSTISAALQPT